MVPPGKEERLQKGARDRLCRAARVTEGGFEFVLWPVLPASAKCTTASLTRSSVQVALPLARLYNTAVFDVIKTKHS